MIVFNSQGRVRAARPEDCLAGAGAMAAMLRAVDWGRTPLGPVAGWPPSLRTALGMMLDAPLAMAVAWGPELRVFYNDACRHLVGAAHPGALGAPGAELLPEIWHLLGPELARVGRGETFVLDDQYLPIARNGRRDHAWFSVSCSPIRDETGGVGGVLAIVSDTTGRVESERRLATLRELAALAAEPCTPEQACRSAAGALANNPTDAPFAIVYAIDDDGRAARRLGHIGLPPDHPAAPPVVDLAAPAAPGWPLAGVIAANAPVVLEDLAARFGELPAGSLPEPADTAILIPLGRPGLGRPHGVLVAGVSPRRALDDRYRAFFELAAGCVAAAINNARNLADQRRHAEAVGELDRTRAALDAAHHTAATQVELLEQIPASIAVVRGDDLVFEMANRHYLASAGLRLDPVGRRALDVFPHLRGRGFEQMIAVVRQTGEPCIVREMVVDGRCWSLLIAPIKDARGEVDRILAFSYEITELVLARQHAEAAIGKLQDAASLLDATLAGVPVGLSVHDRDLRVVRINDTLARWTGLDRERLIGRRLEDVVPRDAIDRVAQRIRMVFATGAASEPLPLAATPLADAAGHRDWLVTCYPVHAPSGEVVQVGVALVDVTDCALDD